MMQISLPPLLDLNWCKDGLMPLLGDDAVSRQVQAEEPIRYAGVTALAMLAARATQLAEKENRLQLHHSVKGTYAWRSGLLSALSGRFESKFKRDDRQVLSHLLSEQDIEAVLASLAPVLHLESDLEDAVNYFLAELLRNVFEHSGAPDGAYLAAGFFPHKQRLTISVVDLGMTVPRHISQRWPGEFDEEAALKQALEPLSSGSRDRARNAGLGLYMTRRISTLMGGRFRLQTGHLIATATDGASGVFDDVQISKSSMHWPGTVVTVTLFTGSGRSQFATELLHAQQTLVGGTARSLDIFRRKMPPGATHVLVTSDVSSLAQDKLKAARIRDSEIMPLVETGGIIALDMAGITLTTQSFAHALLAQPIRELGRDGVAERLWIVSTSGQVKDVFRIVLSYILDELDD